ncbi:hypothetical protein GPECTOR_3g258 [Gonium pectorale]|uniref:Carbohydrate kinase PfkB domain-containing protein n=1 Tax=Gonium pectorale TaxID=33097 RepID=A0A150GZA1_GONPE|nr:hypothetical protein GPECTOR_3g258 [Gonium pectorale]|eukprot:KXZ55104.1 hypothetical protein GPECTOR_3g258 [Gonium pectorale]
MRARCKCQGCDKPLDRPIKVVGMGSCGVDYLASVAAYPRPDEKLRTETLETQGGGNAANALTAAARLGLSASLVTKIGGDGLGDGMLSELRADGIDTSAVLRAAGHPSPFTYIIVDRTGGTRTCIHTPGAPLEPSEMTPALLEGVLSDAALVYFDGRLTEAAVLLARAARARGIPVLVEAERLRPSLELLLAEADYVVTSEHFPRDWTGEAGAADAVLATMERLPRAAWLITTMGTRGALLLERPSPAAVAQAAAAAREATLEAVVSEELAPALAERKAERAAEAAAAAVCVSGSGLAIGAGEVAEAEGWRRLHYSAARDTAQAARQAAAAAERAAALNADAGRADSYGGAASAPSSAVEASSGGVVARVTMASIASIPKEAVVDTTGAGDAFIGSVLYGLSTGMALMDTLRLAAVVAACKCTALGARAGLPKRSQLAKEILGAA